jgi:hypothetical protein
MHSFDNAIDLEHKKLVAVVDCHQSAVISRSGGNCFSQRKTSQQQIKQSVLAQITEFHCEKISGNARAVRVTALNNECMVIGTRMEPLHSYAIAKQLPRINNGINEGKCACAAANKSALNAMPIKRPK